MEKIVKTKIAFMKHTLINYGMTRRSILLILIMLFCCQATIKADSNESNEINQNTTSVSGTVVDINGEAIIGANILEKGTRNGTITDIDGNFSLSVNPRAVLQISFLGYKTQEISVEGKRVLSVVLADDTETLDEVVVVGFGVQKKVNLTGAVGTVNSEMLKERPVANAVQALQGLVPGLNITTPKEGGQLDTKKSINIRGTGTIDDGSSGDPLVLIDGMEGDLTTLNPQDIENISILKDAAASSIYGSRAAFGVILVTTKSGREGRPVINYNNSFRFNTPVMMPKMQNSWEFVNYMNDAQMNTQGTTIFSNAVVQAVKDYIDGNKDPRDTMFGPGDEHYAGSGGKWDYDHSYGNVNWLDQYYTDWATSQEHNISVSGGNNNLSYYLSGNFLTQDGFLRYGTEDYNRYNLTAKINSQITKYVKVGYSSRWSRVDYGRPSRLNDGFYQDIMRRGRPTRPVYDPNGYLMNDMHLLGILEDGGRTNFQNDDLSQQLSMTITPLKNWNIIGEFNVRSKNDWTHEELFRTYGHYATNPEDVYVAFGSYSEDNVTERSYKSTYLNGNIYSNYFVTLDKHTIGGTVGFQTEQYKNREMKGGRNGLISTDLPVLSLTTKQESTTLTGAYNNWRTAGFFARINYDYNGKYLLEANGRYDATSRYRAGNRWVWTPSVSVGWNIAREEFWEKAADYVQFLKLRVSYGVLANQNTKNWYPTYEVMKIEAGKGGWLVNGDKPNIATAPGLVSRALTWEKVGTTNFGLDFGALENRLTGSFDYYIRNTKDMLGPGIQVPATLGAEVPRTNNTDLKTLGWELELGWKDRIKDFSYGMRVNISDSRTKITRYPNMTGSLWQYREGEYTGNIYGYTTLGIAKTQEEMDAHLATLPNGGQTALGSGWGAGDIMYADLDGSGKIDGGAGTLTDMGDLKKIGNKIPRFRTGVTVDLAYKGFDFQMFWQGVLKRDYYIEGAMFWGMHDWGEFWTIALKEHLNYFRPDDNSALGQNLDAYYPRPVFSNKNRHTQTRYLQNAAYMRLKNIQLGYTFPKQWVHKIALQNLRVYVSGENLLTITNLSKTVDPETVMDGIQQGGAIYPLSKTLSVGLSVNF